MTTTTIARSHVRDALARVRAVLVEAAGDDKRLSQKDVDACLAKLAGTERAAVDAFANNLRSQRKKGGVITVADIDRALVSAQRRTAPMSGPAEISIDDVRRARVIGESLVALAQRLAGIPGAVLPPIPHDELRGLAGDDLLRALRERCLPHVTLSYGTARDVMYLAVDAKAGVVRDVYTGRTAPSGTRAELAALGVNAEHTYPQSLGVEGTPAKSDLHHLFPTDALANGKRSSLPLGDVVTVIWEKDGARLGTDASGALAFEPPDAHKGDAARALFYVAALYGLTLPQDEERAMRRWHKSDVVDADERARNDRISAQQENRNPFVDDPDLVDDIRDF